MLFARTNSRSQLALLVGTACYVFHFALCAVLFAVVHTERQSQGEFAWMLFMRLDYPSSDFLWDHLSNTALFTAIVEWGYLWGSGPNLRAFLIHGVFGGLQWFLLGFAFTFLLRTLWRGPSPQ